MTSPFFNPLARFRATPILAFVALVHSGAVAAAQEGSAAARETRLSLDGPPPTAFREREEDPAFDAGRFLAGPHSLVRDLGEERLGRVGVLLGVLRARKSDEASYFGGLEAQLQLFDFLALQVAGSAHRTSYESGDIIVTQYPVQLNIVIYPFPYWEAKPFLSGGAGVFPTNVDFRGALEPQLPDERKTPFGGQVGAGVEIVHNAASASLQADFVRVDGQALERRNLDYWQVVFTLNFCF